MKKLHVAVLFGGRSGEHDVSLMSARSVLSVLDPVIYEVTQIGITREGKWLTGEDVLGKFEQNNMDGLTHFVLSPDPSDVKRQTSNVDVFFEEAEKISEYPLFTKPANLGSSVGVTKCSNRSDLQEGLMEAASFDRRVLIQKGIRHAREIEVSVLGNENPVASVPGEVLPSREFYSYESKYIDGTSGLLIPANLPAEVAGKICEYAVRAYKAVDCAGMARVDFFVEKDTNQIHLNELNTIPGFTKISMYPKLWEASGLPYNKLVDRLIELAMERKAERDRTSYTYRSNG